MNTQPPRQPEHLSDEERELARVVRALPGGEPPAALDALILKAASDAVASSDSPKKSRWSKAWLGTSALWLGTAAASILTVGIGWEVFQSMRAPIYELPADENISSAQEVDNSHKNDSIAIEVIPAREPAVTVPPPQIDSAAEQENAAAGAMASLEKEKATKSEMRAAEIDSRREMADAGAAKKTNEDKSRMRNDQAIAADMSLPEVASPPAPAAVAAPPPMPAMSAAAPSVAGNADRQQLGAVTVTGSRVKQVGNEKVGPQTLAREADAFVEEAISEDAKLAPELWLAAIQARVDRSDINGAKASLKLFKKTYPKQPIPEELKPLLK